MNPRPYEQWSDEALAHAIDGILDCDDAGIRAESTLMRMLEERRVRRSYT